MRIDDEFAEIIRQGTSADNEAGSGFVNDSREGWSFMHTHIIVVLGQLVALFG
ncbi:hypothetical protein KIPE111705_25770 [Kibdelosporangium persicum]|uniref:hypothetical protein n=1 Tax=Kibdelosporangium persicum TaxID=2698649 RepID=UPI001567179F|nr:hypothetical protein [Kibdelosporangium persicum]